MKVRSVDGVAVALARKIAICNVTSSNQCSYYIMPAICEKEFPAPSANQFGADMHALQPTEAAVAAPPAGSMHVADGVQAKLWQ